MQSLPPAGAPFASGSLEPVSPLRGGGPANPPLKADRLESAPRPQGPLITPSKLKPPPEDPYPNPRPWPPSASELPRSSALAALATRGQAGAVGEALLAGPLGHAILTHLAPPQTEPGDAIATTDGWKLPRNPNRSPVQPRDPFNIQMGTEELGPLQVVPSNTGRLRVLRLQWPEEFQEPAFSAQKAVLQDVLTRLASDVTVHVVAEGLASVALPKLLSEWAIPEPGRVHIHALHLHSTPELLYEPMTMWARDGALLMRTQEGQEVLLLPRSFRGDGQVDPKLNRLVIQGTGAAPARLEQALPDLLVRRSGLSFEGGDVIASRRAVLVGGQTVARNMADLRLTRQAVIERLTQLLGVPVIPIEPQPEFHLDLGFTFLDEETIAVADPTLGIRLAAGIPELKRLVRATQEKQLAEKYDRAAQALGHLGYRVVRLPNLCGLGLTTPYLTYNNVLIEKYGQVKRVYQPVYDFPTIDEAARATFRQHGFQVVDMPSARLSTKLWGAIRCATGELRVSDS